MSDGDEPRLRRASLLAGVAEGVVAAALPLLAANITRDPLAIAGVVAAQHLPWIVVALAWRLAERVDRRTVVGLVHTARSMVALYLGFHALAGTETILKIQLVALLVGLGEALTGAVEEERDDTDRLSARGMIGVGLVGMPLGGVLYEGFVAVPFLADVLFFALAALFGLLVRRPVRAALGPSPADGGSRTPPIPRLAKGTAGLALTGVLASVGTSAVLGVLVLFALDDLGLGAPSFGFLLAGLAAATAAGGWIAPDAGRALGLKAGFAVACVVAAAALVTAGRVARPERPWAAVLALAIAWATATAGRVLLRALVPASTADPGAIRALHLLEWGGVVLGALLGGWFARQQGVADVLTLGGAAFAAAGACVATVRPRVPATAAR